MVVATLRRACVGHFDERSVDLRRRLKGEEMTMKRNREREVKMMLVVIEAAVDNVVIMCKTRRRVEVILVFSPRFFS